MTARLYWLPALLLLAVTACSKHIAAPAAMERTATEIAAAKAVSDTDASLRDAAAPLPEAALPQPQVTSAQ
jgi:hypothetical protein